MDCLQGPQKEHGYHGVLHELIPVHVFLVAHQPEHSFNTVGLQHVAIHYGNEKEPLCKSDDRAALLIELLTYPFPPDGRPRGAPKFGPSS